MHVPSSCDDGDDEVMMCPQMSADILGTSCDQCRSMIQYSFTSTETRRLVRTDSPGRPPRLSHSSGTMVCGKDYKYIVCLQSLVQGHDYRRLVRDLILRGKSLSMHRDLLK